jgi:large subunit ribosomal protein L3
MLTTVFATKIGMTQAWTQDGKRCAVTKCRISDNKVVAAKEVSNQEQTSFQVELAYGTKKLANMTKPLRTKLERSGFSSGATHLVEMTAAAAPAAGSSLKLEEIVTVGDIVQVQGISKGYGFAGAMKRHGFAGGPRTHGQSDRGRAVGSIGNRTTPGRVWKGKRMPGNYGVETNSVKGLVVLHIDPTTQEVWLSGPVPGHLFATVRIDKTGQTKDVTLNKQASGIKEVVAPATEASAAETTTEAAA